MTTDPTNTMLKLTITVILCAWSLPDCRAGDIRTLAGLELVRVESGEFQEGAENNPVNPLRKTVISESYWMAKFEISQDFYQQVTGTNPSAQKGGRHPVETVSWHEAVAFCKRLTETTALHSQAPGLVFRLPTSAEWEYAARGGPLSKDFPFAGGKVLKDVGWGREETATGHRPVGLKPPNELGLHDMTGNVWEWCIDSVPASRTGKPGTDTRVKRGGSFNNSGPTSWTVNIGEMAPDQKGQRFGFRVVLAKPLAPDAAK